MAIRRLFGTATLDAGVFWEDKVNFKNWRIQYNETLDAITPLKPFRLLDPKGCLWASSDTFEEMAEALPGLVDEFSAKSPLFSGDDVKGFIRAVFAVAATIVIAKIQDMGKES